MPFWLRPDRPGNFISSALTKPYPYAAATVAAKSAKPTTPLVFVIGQDPVTAGLLARLDRPGGNATGVSDFVNQLVGKRLELIQQAAARVKSVGLLVSPRNPNAESSKEKEAAVIALGKPLLVVRAMNGRELEASFAALAQERVSVLCVNIDPFLIQAQDRNKAPSEEIAGGWRLDQAQEWLREFGGGDPEVSSEPLNAAAIT